MKRLVIFDLDGTLLDTVADLARATNHALERMGLPLHSQDAIRSFVGNGVGKLLERALPPAQRTEARLATIRELFLDHYDRHCTCLTRPYPGIPELLGELRRRGLLLAIASNKYQRATALLASHCLPGAHFACVLGQREGVPVKPHPAIVQDILASAGVPPQETLYVGDSAVDMLTAHQAGVEAVGVDWGFRPRAELEACHPLAVVSHPQDLLQWL